MKKYKLILKIIWLVLIAFAITCFFVFPDYFDAHFLREQLQENEILIAIIYITLTCIRSLFFIPSTVFVILGLALYPTEPIFVIIINLIGVLIGGMLLYGAAHFFTDDALFSNKKQQKLTSITTKMKQYGFPIVLVWSFFPAVPTDIICYVAGAIRMKISYFLSGLLIGETILISIYVYSGKGILDWLF